MLWMCVSAATNLNNFIGVAHLEDSSKCSVVPVECYGSAPTSDETHDETIHDDVCPYLTVLTVLDMSRSIPGGSLKAYCVRGHCAGRSLSLGVAVCVDDHSYGSASSVVSCSRSNAFV